MILDRLRAGCDEAEGAEWTAGIDATVVRAHQHAAGARHEPPKDIPPERLIPCWASGCPRRAARGAGQNDSNPPPAPSQRRDREALGRSRGGLTTKIHLLADRRCAVMAVSSGRDAKEGKGPGRVAAIVSQRGGDVGCAPVPAWSTTPWDGGRAGSLHRRRRITVAPLADSGRFRGVAGRTGIEATRDPNRTHGRSCSDRP
jgi:hypothetical protein